MGTGDGLGGGVRKEEEWMEASLSAGSLISPPPSTCTFFLNSLRPGHMSPPPPRKKSGITSSADTLKPKVHPLLNPGCTMLCKRWRWVGQDGVGGQRQEECPHPHPHPPTPTCTLTSCAAACRKLFVHRHKASLSESCREKLTVVSLS